MAVEPDSEQFAEVAALAGGEADGPVVMLNLNRYRDRPSMEAFAALATDPEVLAAREHRLAGLERATLICCEP